SPRLSHGAAAARPSMRLMRPLPLVAQRFPPLVLGVQGLHRFRRTRFRRSPFVTQQPEREPVHAALLGRESTPRRNRAMPVIGNDDKLERKLLSTTHDEAVPCTHHRNSFTSNGVVLVANRCRELIEIKERGFLQPLRHTLAK